MVTVKVGALSRSVIFDGAQILYCWSESQRILSGPLPNCWKLWRAWNVWTKEDGYAIKFGHHPKLSFLMGLKSTQWWPESERTLSSPMLESYRSWARELQRDGPGRIWARDHLLPRLLQNALGSLGGREKRGGFEWKIPVLDWDLPLPLLEQE